MKKIFAFAIALTLVLSLCSCVKIPSPKNILGNILSHEAVEEAVPIDEYATEEYTYEYVDTTEYPEVIYDDEEWTEATEVVVETTAAPIVEDVAALDIAINARKLSRSGEGWWVAWESLYLSNSDCEKYPALAYAIEGINADAYYAAASSAEGFSDPEYVIYYGDEYDQVKYVPLRADATVVSIREDSEGYYGGTHGSYYSRGINIDTESGNRLELSDVVLSVDMLYVILTNYLNENCADALYESLSANDLHNYYGTNPVWTIDNEKLTVYFNTYEIGPYASGLFEVEIPFAGYEYLFNAKYIG